MRGSQEPVSLIGNSAAAIHIREEATFAAGCDSKVLVTGESGVGKEVVARMIHAESHRRHNPLVTVNCAALSETLLETELFGHVRGSFTGAFRDRSGALEQAHRGTVFLDEVGEMTPRMQGLLLRFLETGEIQRVGSDQAAGRVNVRVIAATNRNLTEAVAARTFREDLFYRLNVFHLHVLPLRERRGDIPAILEHFFSRYAAENLMPPPGVSPDAEALLTSYRWPGNVRELKNVVERLVVRCRDGMIDVDDLPSEVTRTEPTAPIKGSGPRTSDILYDKLVRGRESFWSVVYAPFMSRDLTRDDLRALVRKGLEQTGGSYRLLVELFQLPSSDYKRFLSFLAKHRCHVAFQPFRTIPGRPLKMADDIGHDAAGRDREMDTPLSA